MSFEFGALDAALTAAVGDDPMLVAELHGAFVSSAKRQIDLLQRARCDGNWRYAAWRLKGLAGSFGATQILALAEEAAISVPGEPGVIRRLNAAVDVIAAHRD
jgi:HPt (histidine-containing phosphotransfer) domain-containing protein